MDRMDRLKDLLAALSDAALALAEDEARRASLMLGTAEHEQATDRYEASRLAADRAEREFRAAFWA